MTPADVGVDRIAIFLPDLRAGGAEHVCLMLAREFLAAGCAVEFLLVRAEGGLLAQVPAGARVVDLGCSRFRQALPRLVARLRRDPPDALLAAMWPLTGIAALANRLAGTPVAVVTSEHTDLRRSPAITPLNRLILRRLGRRLYGLAAARVAVSQGVADSLVELTGLAPGDLTVIHNPVRPPTTTPLPDDDMAAWWRGGTAALVAVGQLKAAKGFDDLIDALALLRDQRVDTRLLIIGDGPDRAALAGRISRLGLGDAVRLVGFRDDPFPYLRAADLFVLSSRWEGFGNVVVEAMSCGTNVVATDCPSGPAELLDGGRFGVLVAPGDPAALAAGIRRALAEPVDSDRLLARARQFTPAIAGERYLVQMRRPSGRR